MLLFEKILYFFSLVPFITLIDFGTDLQPWAIVVAIVEVVYIVSQARGKLILTYNQILIYCLCFTGIIIVLLFNDGIYMGVRDSLAYITIICVTLGSYYLFVYSKGMNEKIIKMVIWLYFFVAFIQKYIYSEFLFFMISGHRTTANRGVPALASEPSFYGYICVFLLFFVYDFKKKRIFYWGLLLFQIIFMASSAVTLIYLAIILICIFVVNLKSLDWRKLLQVFGVGCVGGLVLYQFVQVNEGNRMAQILRQLFAEGNFSAKLERFYNNDASISARVNEIAKCFIQFAEGFGMPRGNAGLTSSGYGGVMIEMGILGIVLILILFRTIYNGYSKREGIVFAVSITCIMFSAIQVATPIFSFYLGYCMFRATMKNSNL